MGRASRKGAGALADGSRSASSAGSKFLTGVSVGTLVGPDQRDPRIGGYREVSRKEAYGILEEMKRNGVRMPNGLDQTDYDHVWSMVIPKLQEEERLEYLRVKKAEREAEIRSRGITNIEAYNTSLPTATEAGAQYDIHAENISIGDSFEIGDGEKARLPGGEFVMGPASVRVEQGNIISQDENGDKIYGPAVVVSAPLGQGIGALTDPLDNDSLVPVTSAEELEREWVHRRAYRIQDHCDNKKPLSFDEAQEIVRRDPVGYGLEKAEGYSGSAYDMKEEDYDNFIRKATEDLVEKTRNDRPLTSEEAERVARHQFRESEPCHELRFSLDPQNGTGGRDLVAPSGGHKGSLEITNSLVTVRPHPLRGPSYLERGVNPEIPNK